MSNIYPGPLPLTPPELELRAKAASAFSLDFSMMWNKLAAWIEFTEIFKKKKKIKKLPDEARARQYHQDLESWIDATVVRFNDFLPTIAKCGPEGLKFASRWPSFVKEWKARNGDGAWRILREELQHYVRPFCFVLRGGPEK